MTDSVLLVIDVQPRFFSGARDLDLQQRVLKRVQKSVASGEPVVLVEYIGAGATCAMIMRALDGTTFGTAYKSQPSGAEPVIQACVRHGFAMQRFELCGLYRDLCVQATAVELHEKLPGAELVVRNDATICSCRTECGLTIDVTKPWQFC